MAQSVTLSSSAAPSAIIDLNEILLETVMQFTVSAGSSGQTWVQVSLDEPASPSPITTWANLSSAIISSNADGGLGALFTVLSPISAVRLMGTTTSTGAGLYATTATLKVLQSVTG